MSYLDLPRICFGGTWTGNVATANNQPYLFWTDANGAVQKTEILDFANVAVLPVTIDGKTPSDAELRQLFNDENKAPSGGTAPDQGANWCYWGANSASFDTKVTAVNLGNGYQTDDPLVGQIASIGRAELCDCNPSGSQATQIFSSDFALAGVALESPRTFSRWVWFYRNLVMGGSAGASGVFEGVLPINQEQWDTLRRTGSPALEALYQAWLAAGDNAAGLSIRYGLFASTSEDGGATTNRVGLVSGAIGLATKDELTSFPNCRTLYNSSYGSNALGPVLLRVDRDKKVISVDLFSALKETGRTRETVVKQDQGSLTLALMDGWTKVQVVGSIPYDQYDMANVNQQGAIVDVSYLHNANEVENLLDLGYHFILNTEGRPPLFTENYWISTDQRDYYLQNGQSGTIEIKVCDLGKPVASRTVYLQQFVVTNDDTGSRVATESDYLCTMPATVTTDGEGLATIDLTAAATGNCVIRFTLAPDRSAVNVLRDGFANIRILPTDDYSNITDQELLGQDGHKLVYENVLRYYYLTYPVMQPIMDFSNYHLMTTAQMLQMLQTVTDPDRWWSYGYMPRTRELPESRRQLLVRWAQVNYQALYGTPAAKPAAKA